MKTISIILTFAIMVIIALTYFSYSLDQRIKVLEISDTNKTSEITNLKNGTNLIKRDYTELRKNTDLILYDLYYDPSEEEMTLEDLQEMNQ